MTPRLNPSDYGTPSSHAADLTKLRVRSWQLITTRDRLMRPGDHFAADVLGVSVLIRNFDGELVAMHNVCAHRHCQLCDLGSGHSAELKCRYHGWRYGADGRTRKLPGAKNFPGLDRQTHRLPTYRVATCGQLVFVAIDQAAPNFADWLGGDVRELADATDPGQWSINLSETLDYAADWKIPIEGSLESYHLGEVHADTFGADPGEEHTRHELDRHGTRFATRYRGGGLIQWIEASSIRWISGQFDGEYRHVHWFPNLMASLNDSLSLIYQIVPVDVGRSRMTVFGFGRAATRGGIAARLWSAALRRQSAKIAMKVLREDAPIFDLVQAGMHRAVSPGILGRCEERLHAFQSDWAGVGDKATQPS